MNVRQTEIATLKAKGQLGVVVTEQVQDGRVQVMDVDFITHRIEAEVVTASPSDTRFNATAG